MFVSYDDSLYVTDVIDPSLILFLLFSWSYPELIHRPLISKNNIQPKTLQPNQRYIPGQSISAIKHFIVYHHAKLCYTIEHKEESYNNLRQSLPQPTSPPIATAFSLHVFPSAHPTISPAVNTVSKESNHAST